MITEMNRIVTDVAWMLWNTVTDGDYDSRPYRALQILMDEENLTLSPAEMDQVIAEIEW